MGKIRDSLRIMCSGEALGTRFGNTCFHFRSFRYDTLTKHEGLSMGMKEAVELFFRNYVNFQGRSRRAEYWWPVLFTMIVFIPLYILMVSGTFLAGIATGVYFLFALAVFLPGIAVVIRRLHDLDKSGWWYLIVFIPFAALLLLYWFCQPGTVGSNNYGADPKGGHDVGVFS